MVNTIKFGLGSGNIATNTVLGKNSLVNNTTGASNTAIGESALFANTTGSNNSALSFHTLTNNTIGSSNTAAGVDALYSNVSGNNLSAFGRRALVANTTGNFNSAFGVEALSLNTFGGQNTAFGSHSLRSNIAGFNNTGLGYRTLINSTGLNNTAVGSTALDSSTSGNDNTALGYMSGYDMTTGSNNTFLGRNAGGGLSTGSNNTIVGANVSGLSAGLSNNIILSNGAGIIKAQHDGTNWTLTGGLTAGGISYPITNGTNGQVLTTNGNHIATWADIPTYTIADGAITSAKISDGTIVNEDISSSAAIAFSKLNIAKSDITALGIPGSDTNTQYTAGTGLSLTGTIFAIDGPISIANGGTGESTKSFVDLTTVQSVGGAKTFTANTAVSGTSTFTVGTGATSLGGTLGVTGASTLTGNTSVGGTLGVTGATTLSGNTSVSGSSTFTVGTGATSLGGSLGVTGDVKVNTDKFTVAATSGNTVIAGTLKVAGGSPAAGKVLISDANGLASWAYNGGTTSTQTGAYTIVLSDKYVFYGSTAGATATFTLPLAAGIAGKEIIIKNKSGYTLTVQRGGSTETIFQDNANREATSITLGIEASNNWVKLVSDGTQWVVFRGLF